MKRHHRILIAAVAVALAGGLGAAAPASAEVAPANRVSCPSVAEVNDAFIPTPYEKRRFGTLEATSSTCDYTTQDGKGWLAFGFYTYASTPKQVEDSLRKTYADAGFEWVFHASPLPALGKDAFYYADTGPANIYWQLTPGVVAYLAFDVVGGEDNVPVAKLFRPMMEVYTIDGERTVNGRQWRTTCESYSATARCRTEIFATTIKKTATGFQRVDDWVFNSLTYRWANRALWENNPLGNTGSWTSADGRQWRTECDTSATGRGACRSYIMTTVYSHKGGTYTQANTWVFNNQVLFNN